MRYYVVADDGNKYGPADVATLNSWVKEGRLVSTTLLEEEGSGARIAAAAVSGLLFPVPTATPGPTTVPGPGPGANPNFANPPGPANPYSAGYANSYQAGPQGGQTETVISWICAGLGFVCCCGILPIVGIVLGIVGKNKGNKNGQAAMIVNIVALVISLLLGIAMFPAFMKGFNEGLNKSRTSSQYSSSAPSFTPPGNN